MRQELESQPDVPPTRRPWRASFFPLLAGLISLLVFLPGIGWGLPSRDADRFLFGDRTPWTGAEIIALAGGFDAGGGRGADVDANPLDRDGDGPVVLNDTDAKRAEIVRRYRLQSHQPDEFINFAAIAGMAKCRDLDPRLYQYGGLWLYPVAGLLGLARGVGYVHLTGDLTFYLDHPEAFGRFYVVARLYSAAWGAVAAAVVFVLIRRLSRSNFAGFCGAVTFALLPVVVTAAHEAKPHLAGAALVQWAVLKADDFVRSGRRRDAVWAGVLCGAGASMVVSMVVGFALLPTMIWLRWRGGRVERSSRSVALPTSDPEGISPPPSSDVLHDKSFVLGYLLASLACGVGTYVLTNPFVIYHCLFDRGVFASNLGNSTAMYGVGGVSGAAVNALYLLGLAFGWPLAVALTLGVAMTAFSWRRRTKVTSRSGESRFLLWLLAAAAVAGLAFFVPLAAGKPAEYARFGLVPVAAALAAWYAFVGRKRPWLWPVAPLLAATIGLGYVAGFLRDGGPNDTRTRAAEWLAARAEDGHATARVRYEPGPWGVPPMDLWHWRIVLDDENAPPAGRGVTVDVRPVEPADSFDSHVVGSRWPTPISWANTAFRAFAW